MRFVVACLFLSFPQIPISLARCAHFSVSLFPSAAPIPPHLGVMAAGHRALWGTAERGGEYLPRELGSRGLGAFCVPLSSPVCHPCGSKKREQPPLKHMTCSQRLLLGSFDHHHLYAFSPFCFSAALQTATGTNKNKRNVSGQGFIWSNADIPEASMGSHSFCFDYSRDLSTGPSLSPTAEHRAKGFALVFLWFAFFLTSNA